MALRWLLVILVRRATEEEMADAGTGLAVGDSGRMPSIDGAVEVVIALVFVA